MNKWIPGVCLHLAMLVFATVGAHAQQSTERYIPIGESPGVSGEESVIGTITDVDYTNYRMQVTSGQRQITVTTADTTRYFLDRTKRKRTNRTGTIRDCEVGRKVEIKTKADGSVDWIKVESR